MLLPLDEIRISGQPQTLESLERMLLALENALTTPMADDNSDYTPFFDHMVDERVDVKKAFDLIVAANYVAMAGRTRFDDEQVLLKELLFSDLSSYPFLLVDQAFKEWRKTHNWFPTPCDIIRQIEGYDGDWNDRNQRRDNVISSLRLSLERAVKKMRQVIEREKQASELSQQITHSLEFKPAAIMPAMNREKQAVGA